MEPQKQEKGLAKYQARDGQEITLSFDNIRRYLVQGNREKVTEQELMYFLAICKSRGLNPFKKDAYLIKYGEDPAAIVTSIDYFRSRARAQKDCKGWRKGIIVQKANGELRDSAGLILDGEILVGGFFEAQPEGWTIPQRLEVNLNGYIKKTKDGKITRFWQPENQPTMIAKVAESQGLRALWPDEFQGIHEESEVVAAALEMEKQEDGSFAMESSTTPFEQLAIGLDMGKLDEFIGLIAENNGTTAEAVKAEAAKKWSDFKAHFDRWASKKASKAAEPTYPFDKLKTTGMKEFFKASATEMQGWLTPMKMAWNDKLNRLNLTPTERLAMSLPLEGAKQAPPPPQEEGKLDFLTEEETQKKILRQPVNQNDQDKLLVDCPDHPGESRDAEWCSTSCPHPPCANYDKVMGYKD